MVSLKFQLYLKDFVAIGPEEIPPKGVQDYDFCRRSCVEPPHGPVLKGILLHYFEEPHIFTQSK
jgi:hypothetical protein